MKQQSVISYNYISISSHTISSPQIWSFSSVFFFFFLHTSFPLFTAGCCPASLLTSCDHLIEPQVLLILSLNEFFSLICSDLLSTSSPFLSSHQLFFPFIKHYPLSLISPFSFYHLYFYFTSAPLCSLTSSSLLSLHSSTHLLQSLILLNVTSSLMLSHHDLLISSNVTFCLCFLQQF